MLRLNPEQLVFVTERHLATLTTLRADGSPHVTPVAFMWDAASGTAVMTTERWSAKAVNARRRGPDGGPPRAALCQVDGGRWMTIEGVIEVDDDPAALADAAARHARRYHEVEAGDERTVLRLTADRVLASDYMA
ncbi:pyridoxamine 5'-phosphate oxidase-related FMN- binding protein [Xylanimonas cellulosilytica DSM 15894]|uniref:Pyridoxamine 5'-phosphate oxidase-related FMN-binding protein n=1 Tax=Xylanimonas cellulosilytica (strain DSM 15894 / JCM 12276 / CECT 5975 / KCTC 9989 / LMG 20990 / NBRC 107835 / XIL07) TaxID=446471 RepID=D1C0E0_XYLCX|nr:TIGR03618 family F420-dependent PPOX class oxidoreductase [Xylanimonas cellulosilytica]ACZ30329.1 pyridoxamine 5'-phosphate oxidase-related FMN- binding protein [Xylanimonas cellulosilytica DSM 15894]